MKIPVERKKTYQTPYIKITYKKGAKQGLEGNSYERLTSQVP